MPAGSTVSSGPTASTIAFSSEANRTPSPRGMMNNGLIPNGSRATARLPASASKIAKANMPRNRRRDSGPQARQASRTTSVSELVVNRAPAACSSVRSSA